MFKRVLLLVCLVAVLVVPVCAAEFRTYEGGVCPNIQWSPAPGYYQAGQNTNLWIGTDILENPVGGPGSSITVGSVIELSYYSNTTDTIPWGLFRDWLHSTYFLPFIVIDDHSVELVVWLDAFLSHGAGYLGEECIPLQSELNRYPSCPAFGCNYSDGWTFGPAAAPVPDFEFAPGEIGWYRIYAEVLRYYYDDDTSSSWETVEYGLYDFVVGNASWDAYIADLQNEIPTPTTEPTAGPTTGPGSWQPCTINVYDADTRLPLSGAWDYYVVIEGADSISGSASGASTVVNLPETSILQPHLLRVTKEGYVQVPETLAFNVPAGGREIPVYLRSTTAAPEEGNVWLGFVCTDADTGSPVSAALVNLDGTAQYTGASGYVRFQVPMNSTHKWVASSSSHWPMGGNVTVETADLNVSVELVQKTSDLPRPPLPDLPNFPVIHPSLDPAGFRMQILSVPYLGDMAEPLLDTVDNLAAGVNDIAFAVLDVLTAPADSIVLAVKGISSQLVEVSEAYLSTGVFVLDSLGMLIAVIPTKVINLVTFGMILDIIILLLRGGL